MMTLHDLLARWERNRQADRDTRHDGLTASAMGTLCRKQTAYRLHDTEPSDDTDPVTVATVGSLLHLAVGWLWDALDAEGLAIEVPAKHGTADVADPLGITTGRDYSVRDLKTLGRDKFDRWLAPHPPDPVTGEVEPGPVGPPDDTWRQLGIYAADLYSRALDEDEVRLVIDALCRETGRCLTYVRDVDYAWCREQVEDLGDFDSSLRSIDPDQMRPDRDGPGDWLCQSCPFRSRCWDDADLTRDPVDAADVELLLADYYHAQQQERQAKERKKAAARQLEGTGPGVFGRWGLRWGTYNFPERVMPPTSGTYPKPYPVED